MNAPLRNAQPFADTTTPAATARLILGIDPGLSGALAFFDPDAGSDGDVVAVHDMPVHAVKGKNHLDPYGLASIVDAHAKYVRLAVFEQVGARPGQGVSSMFRFGQAFGIASGVVSAFYIPTHFVLPGTWKRAMKLSSDKDASRQLATRMFPTAADRWRRKKDDGRAEALLLAVYGSKHVLKG